MLVVTGGGKMTVITLKELALTIRLHPTVESN